MEVDIEVTVGGAESINVSSANGVTLLVSGPCRLLGWSIAETTGAAVASCEFSTGQTVIGESYLAAGDSDTHSMPLRGVECPQGLSVSAVTGTFKGCAYIAYYV